MGKFYGRYERNLDERNRLQLPSKLFSSSLPDSFFALKGFDGCLSLYEKEAFEKLEESLSSYSYLEKNARALIRLTLSSVRELEIDAHGRITIPKDLSERYKLSSSVTVLGVNDHFEIWDAKIYQEYEEAYKEHFDEIAERLGGNENGRTL